MKQQRTIIIRLLLSILFIEISVCLLFFPEIIPTKLTSPFYFLLVIGTFLAIFPIENIKQLKYKEYEILFDKEEIKAAINSLALNKDESTRLESRLKTSSKELDIINGSRVLWIDDHPGNLVLLRRVLRSFGSQVISAISSERALELINEDNDIDLIVSDVQRTDFQSRDADADDNFDGVNFIKYLRNEYQDPIFQTIPVLFYAAYDYDSLVKLTEPARHPCVITEVLNESDNVDFILKIISLLYESRKSPSKIVPQRGRKKPTGNE